ncbi:ribonuclease E/G [Anaeromicropila populeti]|uniref:Ribonuclease G n=1 Tax=Anaeromicropila populeti TaxID=37658 RepID=A0A1I6L369_9FIRM|nr:ribonuclease E/G [Anaeromicropila populeti]SFR97670.1 ribonuclease G [Anaeromicropila populeti]
MCEGKNRLIILRMNQKYYSILIDSTDVLQINVENSDTENYLGDIYLGKVKNIVKNINAAFVEISPGMMCYLALSKQEQPIYSNGIQKKGVQAGDEIIVQVDKENIKTKAPSVTCNFNLTGKYVVLTYGKSHIGISAKIKSEKERQRLKNAIAPFVTEQYGFVVRTNSEGISDDLLLRELMFLKKRYERIISQGIHFTRFSLIEKGLPGFLCDIRDNNDKNLDAIITDDKEIFQDVRQYLLDYQEEDVNKLRFYEDTMISLRKLYSLDTKIEKALQKKVWLKSGGYIVIEPTEALTVIDVNTGKAVHGKKNEQETFFKINMESANEIAKQLRLRNISGIIIIDFIDMKSEEKKTLIMTKLKELFAKDPVKTVLVDMTQLNLVEVTRKKVRKPLWEQLNGRNE